MRVRGWGDIWMFADACGGEERTEGLLIHGDMNEDVDYHLVQQDELIISANLLCYIINSHPSLTHKRSTDGKSSTTQSQSFLP